VPGVYQTPYGAKGFKTMGFPLRRNMLHSAGRILQEQHLVDEFQIGEEEASPYCTP
jgi:hypothetical protein